MKDVENGQNGDIWAEASAWSEDSVETDDVACGETLASLGLMYLRHGDVSRAMVLGLTALSLGDASPRTALLIADALLKNGDSEQVLAVLSRFSQNTSALTRPPTSAETAAKDYLKALALYRSGQPDEARSLLATVSSQIGTAK